MDFLYPSLSLIELQKFPKPFKRAISNFSKSYVCLQFFFISPEKDEETIYRVIHLVEISKSSKTTIQVDKNKCFKVPACDNSWINCKRLTDTLAIKCHSEQLMSKGARTLYYENNFILITVEGPEYVSIDDNLFDFSYELELKNFHGIPSIWAKFAELYQSEKEKVNIQVMPSK